MIVVSTAPCRLSFVGGGTDVGEFSKIYGGATVSLAINIRQRFTLFTDDDMWAHHGEQVVPYGCRLLS